MAGNESQTDWRKMLDEVHERIRIELAGRTLPAPEDIIRQGREDRDVQLFMALGNDALRPIASKHGLKWTKRNASNLSAKLCVSDREIIA